MLGSGFGLYAVEAFKRDKKRRKQHTPFSNSLLMRSGKKIKNVFPKATKIQLLAIREKMKKQHRKDRDILILSFVLAVVSLSGLVIGFTYLF